MTSVLTIDRLGGDPGLALAGELDVSTAPQLIAELAAIASEDDVLLDLTDLTFIDSAGMHVIRAFARCRNGRGRVVLANPSHAVLRSPAVVAAEHEVIEIVARSGDSASPSAP